MYVNQNKAILAGVLSGIFWGTPFLIPQILTNFSAFQITFGRFFFFGIISLCGFIKVFILVKTFSLKQLIQVLILSATGFWLYTLILFTGVKLTNGVLSSLIIGCLPLTIIIFSKPKINKYLISGIILIVIGITSLLLYPILFKSIGIFNNIHINGLLLLFIALIMWTWFGIHNSKFMALNPNIRAIEYSSLIGVINFIFIIPIALLTNDIYNIVHQSNIVLYVICCSILGFGASWIANILWTYSAKYCPPSIGGALIVSETLFGLIYSFIFEKRLPHANETIAILCLLTGVILVITSQKTISKQTF